MALSDQIASDISSAIKTPWDIRDGQVVPETDGVILGGGGVRLNASFLYADLADSTSLAIWNRQVTAKICKAFLSASSRIIRQHSGHVRSFDGDRVLGVFVGERKNTNAALCALRISWMFNSVLKPAFLRHFSSLSTSGHKLGYACGIDTSETLVVRSGIRNSNDLIWIGRAPNIAAKLCSLRYEPYTSWITGDVFDALGSEAKTSMTGIPMWEERVWNTGPVKRVFRSSWFYAPK